MRNGFEKRENDDLNNQTNYNWCIASISASISVRVGLPSRSGPQTIRINTTAVLDCTMAAVVMFVWDRHQSLTQTPKAFLHFYQSITILSDFNHSFNVYIISS